MELALFFTRGVSLKTWIESGIFDREKLLYEEHLKRGNFKKIYWLTYGDDDRRLATELKKDGRLHNGIEVVPIPWFFTGRVGRFLYTFLMPIVHSGVFRRADVYKTNQMDGSWTAVLAKWTFKKPLIVRTGFTASLFAKTNARRIFYGIVERFAYRWCDAGVVSSRKDRDYVISKNSRSAPGKIRLIYNYVDTNLFSPSCRDAVYVDRIVFVGRLTPQKNIPNLIAAMSGTDMTLDIYGAGEEETALKAHAKAMKARVNFMGVVPNAELPSVLSRYRYYVLPSRYEGMPKTLLEAMACGLVCIGTNVDGINEVIEDDVTGFLARGTDSPEILEAIMRAVNSDDKSISERATQRILRDFSLEAFVEKELQIMERFSA